MSEKRISETIERWLPFDAHTVAHHQHVRIVALRWKNGKARWFAEYPVGSKVVHALSGLEKRLKSEARQGNAQLVERMVHVYAL